MALLGVVVIVPEPFPIAETETVGVPKVAVTASGPFMVTAQVPVPEQPAPLHPVNTLPAGAVATSVTTSPAAKFAEHVLGQVMPSCSLLTAGIG